MKRSLFVLLALAVSIPASSFGQTFGIGLTASSLGAGIQAAAGIGKYSNIRGGFNAFDYSNTVTKDGISYNGTLKLRSAEVLYDQYFPHLGGFHISPGLLIYDDNQGNATATIASGQSFTLNNATYYSSSANPVNGTGGISFSKAAPMVLIGFGNLLPRSRHFGFNFELGAVFQGSPNAKLGLAGTACLTPTTGCVNAATDPGFQTNLQAEQTKLNNTLTPFKYYPVISLGFSYKF